MKLTAWNPFRMRGLFAVVLAIGLLVGIWLGDLFKGFGWGPGQGGGPSAGSGSAGRDADSSDGTADLVGYRTAKDDKDEETSPPKPDGMVKVLIDDRSYFLRRGGKQAPISLGELVKLIRNTKPNEDGLRAIIDRTPASRASTEDALFEALRDAGIPDKAWYLVDQSTEQN